MESQALIIRAQRQLSMSRYRRVLLRQAKVFCFLSALTCTLFHLAVCGPCFMNGMPSPVEHDEACESYRGDSDAGFQDVYVGDVSSSYLSKNQLANPSVCMNSDMFCFPSTLPGYCYEDHPPESTELEVSAVHSDATSPLGSTQARNNLSWSSDYGLFKLLSGRTVACSLNSQEGINDISSLLPHSDNQNYVSSCGRPLHSQKSPSFNLNANSQMIKSGFVEGSLSPHMEISPSLVDWGQKPLYFPSFAFLTVANTHSDSILEIYEPFSTNTQFYPCNFSEVFLGPGEVASICFVFLPIWLGLSSAHLILQTSYGGFLVQAKGFAVDSPYGIQPLVGLEISSSGRWSKNFSLLNPFDETLQVKEATAWISVPLGSTSHSAKAICRTENAQGSDEPSVMNVKEWLDVSGGEVGSTLMAIKPHRNWDINPGSTETIIEFDFSHKSAGRFFGAFCMQLLRPSQDKLETVIVPLEAELGGESLAGSVMLSLQTLVPCDGSETAVVALSLRNVAPHLLNVIQISVIGKGTEFFKVKYMEGLILFPGTATQAAVVSYVPRPSGLHDSLTDIRKPNLNCKLMILTNDSSNPEIEALCKDIVSICSKVDSYPKDGQQAGKAELEKARTVESSSWSEAMEEGEPDELVLGNWKSQGTVSGMSVLDGHEVLFPMTQVGTHHSKWITVKNPSQQPVVMQLILNTGVIIDKCSAREGLLHPSSYSSLVLSEYTPPTRYGFSIAQSALTEAYVHPYETASFGPIYFRPSNCCGWTSSALIRNNLSGVEWLSLKGFGGSISLVLYDGSKRIQNVAFNFNLPSSLNFSPNIVNQMEETAYTCSQPLLKELYAKNTGDLPLEVRRIKVSGSECGLDGFAVHTCKGFALEPGESTKLLISYQADFSSVLVQRDLELALGTGTLVIPMEAILPGYLFNLCKRSLFWMRVKKLSFAILFAAVLMFLVLCGILPQWTAVGSHEYIFNSGKSSITTVRRLGKSSRVHRNQKSSDKFVISSETDDLLRASGGEEALMLGSSNRYPYGEVVPSGKGITTQQVKPSSGNQRQGSYLLDTQREIAIDSCAPPELSTVEDSDLQEASKDGKLTVKIGKEKGRRRRKKKVLGSGLIGILEVSSSHSGNSTPSSPLSPVTAFTPKRSWPTSVDADQSVEARNPFARVAEQQGEKSCSGAKPSSNENVLEPEVSIKYADGNSFSLAQKKPSTPGNMSSRPLLLPCATFPSACRPALNLTCPFLASTSSIAPHSRAPGSKLCNQKTVETEENRGLEDQFKYDIWGDHLFGLHLKGRPMEVSSAMTSGVTENKSESFFVRGPQTLVTKSQLKSASCSYQVG